jgi:hypothetical protein
MIFILCGFLANMQGNSCSANRKKEDIPKPKS